MNRSRLLLDVTSEFPWTCPSARLPRERGNKRQIHTLALSGAPSELKVEISNGNTSRIDSFTASTLEWFIRIRFINYAGAFFRENESKSEREMEWGFSLVWNFFRLFHRKRKKFAERAEKFFFPSFSWTLISMWEEFQNHRALWILVEYQFQIIRWILLPVQS